MHYCRTQCNKFPSSVALGLNEAVRDAWLTRDPVVADQLARLAFFIFGAG